MATNRSPLSRSLRAAALAAAVAVAPLAAAQFTDGSSSSSASPWSALKLNPKTRVKVDYRNASIDAIIAWYQSVSGVTIVKDPSLTGTLTISSAKSVPLSEAFQILKTTVGLKGYDMRNEGSLLVIRKREQQGRGNNQIDWSQMMQPSGPDGGGGDNTSQLKVYPVTYANASQVARIINEVFADSGSQNFGGFRLDNQAGAVNVEAGVQGPGGFGRGGQGGRGGFNFGGQGGNQNWRNMMGRFGQSASVVKASSDDYSNQVIVSAPDRFQYQVRDIIKQLDKVTDTPTQTKVYHLEYASATDSQTIVQNILNANVPRGRGGATTQQSQGPGAFFSAIRGQQTGSGTVTADARTNNLVVTATPENIKIVDQIIQNLDTNVPVESTTFVFQLNNAKAEDVATLLQSAFGTRTGVNGGRNTTNRTSGSTQNRNNQNRNNTQNRGFGANIGNDEEQLALADDGSGDLATSVGVTQGFGQGFFGGQGQNRNTQNQSTTGRGANGQIVNTRDLSNQVTAIADQSTNSIIVEASLNSSDKLGVEFSSSRNGNTTTNIGSDFTNVGPVASDLNDNQGFQYTITGSNYNVFLNALKSDSKFQVLSTPKIFTSNNLEASINISQRVPYITSSRQDINGNFTFSYDFEDVGVILTVVPRITSNGMVSMDVTQTASDLQGYTSFNAPIINQRTADTTVSVKDGDTIILGGIIRRTVNTDVRKVPVLGDIPVLGQLFRSNVKQNQKTELLVFLTPRIVRDPDEARRLREENERKMSPETQRSFNDYRRTGNNDKTGGKPGEPSTRPIDPPKTTPPVTTPPPVKQP